MEQAFSDIHIKNQIKLKENDEISFLGSIFDKITKENADNQSKILQDKFQDTFWFTYRKNFSPLLQNLKLQQELYKEKTQALQKYKEKVKSDKGWGCMLRVGQNILTEAIKRHLYQQNIKFNYNYILGAFKDEYSSIFSIHQIAEKAFLEFEMLPGEWYPPNRIMSILSQIQQKNPIKGTENLNVVSMNSDLPISYEEILQNFDSELKFCEISEHIDEKIGLLCQKCHLNQQNNTQQLQQCEKDLLKLNINDQQQQKTSKNTQKSVFLVINSRIGLESTPQHFLKQVKQILNFELCVGIIGGNMGSAHYFIGNINDNLIYLDPHTTQQAVTSENFNDYKTITSFFCNEIKTLPLKKLNQSLGIGFYLKDLGNFQKFHNFIVQMEKDEKELFWYFCEKTPDYMKEKTDNNNKNDDQQNQKNNQNHDDSDSDGFIIIE